MILMVRCGCQPSAIAMRSASVSTAMPDALSSAPGASIARPDPAPEIESRWPPRTTISSGRSVPSMVRITEGCEPQARQLRNSSAWTSLRPAPSASHTSWIHSAESLPCALW